MKPFLKYAGGKRRLCPEILARLPDTARITYYVEPFVGGGAAFLALRAAGYTGPAILNDASPIVTAVWQAVQLDPEAVLRDFQALADRHSREAYYEIRAEPPVRVADWSHIVGVGRADPSGARRNALAALAAWFLYLNKAGFNGLWRVNRKGLPNVPCGDYAGAPKLDEAALRGAHEALRGATVLCGDFSEVLAARDGAMVVEDAARLDSVAVYCDPPYLPVSATAAFTAYTRGGFGPGDQLRLARWCRDLADRGARVVLSNAGIGDSEMAFARLADRADPVQMARAINSKGARRGAVREYLFTFEPPGAP